MTPANEPPRISADEARTLRYAAGNLRKYANEPFTNDLDALTLRAQADELDQMTNEYAADWPVVKTLRRPA